MFHHAEAAPMADIKKLRFYNYTENMDIQSNAKNSEVK